MAAHVPRIAVLALGTGALGGADALRVLLGFAGQSPFVDIAVCVFVVGMVTAQLLGAMLLVRFVRKTGTGAGAGAGAGRGTPGRAGAGAGRRAPGTPGRARAGTGRGAAGTDPFAKMTLLVSLAVAFLVAACLLVASGGLVDSAAKSPMVAALVISAAAAATVLPRTMPLLRVARGAHNADGAAPAARATETTQTEQLVRTRNGAGASGAAAHAWWCFPKLACVSVTSLAVVSFTVACLLVVSFTESDAGKHASSV